MITTVFFVQLLLTFAVGSIWIYLTVFLSKRFGSKVGGFIGGLPSTALLSFFFIGFTQSTHIASEATTVFPLVYCITVIFLVVYAWISKHGFGIAILCSLLTWFILSAVVAMIDPANFILILIGSLFLFIFSFYVMEKKLKIRSHSKVSINYTVLQTFVRAIFGGIIIMLAVLFAKIGGPVFGGIFAAFPAMFISTLTITYRAYGIDFSKALTKPFMVTGMFTIVVYVIAVRYSYPVTGLYFGTLISILVSAASASLTFLFIQRKLT